MKFKEELNGVKLRKKILFKQPIPIMKDRRIKYYAETQPDISTR